MARRRAADISLSPPGARPRSALRWRELRARCLWGGPPSSRRRSTDAGARRARRGRPAADPGAAPSRWQGEPAPAPPPPGSRPRPGRERRPVRPPPPASLRRRDPGGGGAGARSEEHTSELQSHSDLVCRLLLEKKKKQKPYVGLSVYLPRSAPPHSHPPL